MIQKTSVCVYEKTTSCFKCEGFLLYYKRTHFVFGTNLLINKVNSNYFFFTVVMKWECSIDILSQDHKINMLMAIWYGLKPFKKAKEKS